MAELSQNLKIVLADMFHFYLKSHNFHWNVTGPNFPQLHSFFGDLYESVFNSLDDIAEHIRAIEEYAPGTFSRFKELTNIKENTTIPKDMDMVKILVSDNEVVMKSLMTAFESAMQEKEEGLANFLSERLDAHKKHQWMLKSIIK